MRVAILGCGVMGGAHAAAYTACGATLVAVADASAERAQALARQYGCAAHTDLVTMLEAEKPEAISICVPAGGHAQAVEQAASRGCAILCEKPFTWDPVEALRCAEILAASGTPFRLGFKMRYENVYAAAREVIDSGELGALRHVFISHFQPLSEPSWYMDVGVTTELLIHSLDIADWLFDCAPLSVKQESQYLLGKSGEDQARLTLAYANNRTALIVGGYMPDFPPIRGQHDFVFQFLCEKGYVAGKRNGAIEVFSASGARRIQPPACNAFQNEISDFLKAARGERAGGATLYDALVSQWILDAAKQSEKSGQAKAVAPIPSIVRKG